MLIRYSKIILVAAMSLYCFLIFFGNVTDYATNLIAVDRALAMKDVFPQSTITYRAIHSPLMQQVIYDLIISFEGIAAVLCFLGALKLFRAKNERAKVFNQAKNYSVAGLTLGFIIYQVFFMSIGGEWFGMWMSPMLHNVLATAFYIFITMLAVLIYVVMKDE